MVYDHPSDYPDHYVIKRDVIKDGLIVRDQDYIFLNEDLEICRNQMKVLNLIRLNRFPEDDPVILETWL